MRRLSVLLFLVLCPLFTWAEQVVHVYNWNDYIAPEVLQEFEKTTGIKVDYHTFSTSEEALQVIREGAPIDVAVPSHYELPGLIKAQLIQPLDRKRLTAFEQLDPQLMGQLSLFDANNQHAVPYLWGAVGLAINLPEAEKAYGGPLPESWSLLFEAEQSQRLKACGISLLDAPKESFSLLLNYQGRSFARSSSKQIERAGEIFKALTPNLRYIDSERYIDDLSSGKLCVAMAWVGDALRAAQAGQPVKFVIPQEGSTLFIDSLVIPSRSKNPELAYRFIDFLMQPKIAAQITAATFYPNANTQSAQYMAPELRDHPGLYPDAQTRRRLLAQEKAPDKVAPLMQTIWAQLRAESAK